MIPTEDTVSIDRWQAEYLIPGGHPAPASLKGSLDDALQRLAGEALDAHLSPLAAAAGESVWLVRRLELDLAANTALDLDRAALTWARQIAGMLDRTLQAGADGENVLYFPDWAAYLAYFLGDLVEGQAWGRWFYRAFEGLRMLPASAAARTAVLDDPQAGFHALFRLPFDPMKRLLEALSDQDARRVLDGFATGGLSGEDLAENFLSACDHFRHTALGEEQFSLLLFLETLRSLEQAGGPNLAAHSRAAARLRRLLANGANPGLPQALISAARGSLADIYIQAGASDAERLLPLASFPSEQLAQLISILATGQAPTGEVSLAPNRRYTSFGGLFLLLPELDRLPLAAMIEGFPPLEDEDPRAALRLLLLARTGGSGRAEILFNDPLARDLVGISPRFTPDAASRWLNRVRRPAWNRFSDTLSKSLPGTDLRPIRKLILVDFYCPTPWGNKNPQRNFSDRNLYYLLAPSDWRLKRTSDLALAQAVCVLLRNFSGRLSGFEASAFAYLFSNFLDFSASLEEEGDRRTVLLGHPALGLVLQRVGLIRQSYRLAWGDSRKFELYPEA